jgi:hypothetical protein
MTRRVQPLYLAEIEAYDPATSSVKVLRYSSGNGYVTGASATPANEWYDARIQQPADVTRNLFTTGATQGGSRVAIGDLVLLNPDGELDALVPYGFDGRSITIWRSTVQNPAYPADFDETFVGTMDVPQFDSTTVTLKLRDGLQGLSLPFQPTKFAGTNALPNGLEGVPTDLQGKPKPVVLGTVPNIAPPCVNTSKLIYQVNDGAVHAIDAVYDRGIPLTTGFPLAATTVSSIEVVNGVTDNGSTLVAVCQSGNIYTSADGVTWTARTSSFGTTPITSVAYSPTLGLFVAVGWTGRTAHSADGITWTLNTALTGTPDLLAVTWGAGLFVAGGNSSTITGITTMYTSPDGITWTSRTLAGIATNGTVKSVAFGNGLFVVVGIFGQGATSPDGITWTALDVGTGSAAIGGTPEYDLQCVRFFNNLWLASGDNGFLFTSIDGLHWVSRTSGFGIKTATQSPIVYGVAYGNGIYFAVGSNGGTFSQSRDGILWSQIASGYSGGSGPSPAVGVVYFAGKFIAFGFAGIMASAPPLIYGSLADLQDDTLAPGQGLFGSYPPGGYFRLGSSPAGTITADVTQGATAANRTAAQLYTTVLARSGLSSSDWLAADITALDAANSAVLGIYIDSETTFLAVIDQIANSVGAGWWPRADGVFRIRQLTAPSGTPTFTVGKNDLIKPLTILPTNDLGKGLPVYRCTVNWGRSYTVQTTDLAGGVTDDRRAVIAQQWRTAVATDLTVKTASLLAPETIDDSLLTTLTDAQAEADRRLALRKVKRNRYDAMIELNDETSAIDLGDVGTLIHPRYGLAAGALVRVLDIQPNAKDATLLLTLWGAP